MRPHSFFFHPINQAEHDAGTRQGLRPPSLRYGPSGDGTPLSCWPGIDRDEGMIFCASGAGSNKGIDRKKGGICTTERKNRPVDGTERKEGARQGKDDAETAVLKTLNGQTARRAVGSATGSRLAFQWKDDFGKRTRLLSVQIER